MKINNNNKIIIKKNKHSNKIMVNEKEENDRHS